MKKEINEQELVKIMDPSQEMKELQEIIKKIMK